MTISNKTLDGALLLASLGFRVFPAHGVQRKPGGQYICTCKEAENCGKTSGKHPRFSGWRDEACSDPERIKAWWNYFSVANVAVATGSGIVAVDVDNPEAEHVKEALALLDLDTVTAASGGSGRYHYYYRVSDKRLTVLELDGLDVRGESGLIIAPPSQHYSGNYYAWVKSPENTPLKPLSEEFIQWALSRKKEVNRLVTATYRGGGAIPAGQRHNFLRREIFKAASEGKSESEVWASACDLASRCEGEVSELELENLVNGAIQRRKALQTAEMESQLTELGLSKALVSYYGDELVYSDEGWYRYGGDLWEKVNFPESLADPVRTMVMNSVKGRDTKEANKFWQASGSFQYLSNTVKLAASQLHRKGALQPPDDTLPFRNGLYDLERGIFRRYRPSDYTVETVACDYVEGAESPLWENTINHLVNGDPDIVRYLRQIFGFLVGTRTMRGIFFFVGPKNTGKTTLINVLCDLLGTRYAGAVQPGLIHATRGYGEDEEMARCALALYGRRFVYMDETKQSIPIDTPKMKRIASVAPTLIARRLRQDAITFQNQAKVVVISNFPPAIDATDDAAWDRVRYVPFLVAVPPGERRETFRTELLREAPGILNWCIKGYQDWSREGFVVPPIIGEQVSQWLEETNVTQQFVAEQCVLGKDFKTKPGVLYAAYKDWHAANGLGKDGLFSGSAAFARELYRMLPALESKRTHGTRWIVGISLTGEKTDG